MTAAKKTELSKQKLDYEDLPKKSATTNRRGNQMQGAAILEEIKLSKEIRSMLKRMLTLQQANQGRFSLKDVILTAVVISSLWLLTWTWYFAVS